MCEYTVLPVLRKPVVVVAKDHAINVAGQPAEKDTVLWKSSAWLHCPPLHLSRYKKRMLETELTVKENKIHHLSSKAPHFHADPLISHDSFSVSSTVDGTPKQSWQRYLYWDFLCVSHINLFTGCCCKLFWPWNLSLQVLLTCNFSSAFFLMYIY